MSSFESYMAFFYLCLGLLIRLRNYSSNVSFWNDEAALALNLLRLNVYDLLSPLGLNQVAPVGFLIFEKMLLSIGGNNELSLRFLPFVAGCATLIFTFGLLCRAVGPLVAVLCMAQLAVINEPIFYSNDLKPYASDLAVAVGLMLLAYKEKLPLCSRRHYIALCLCGIMAIWFSFPAIFVLGGIAIVYCIYLISGRQWQKLGPVTAMSAVWVLAFVVQYNLVRSQTINDALLDFWKPFFLTFPPVSSEDIKQYVSIFYTAFKSPVWTLHPLVSIPLFIGGCIIMWINYRKLLLIVLIPLILNLIAACLHKYPFGDRLLQYGVLNLYIPIAVALGWMVKGKSKLGWIRILGIILILGNLTQPTINATKRLIWPKKHEQMKQVVAYIRTHMLENDTILVHGPTSTTFSYYRERFQVNLDNMRTTKGFGPTPSDFCSLSGRVWLVFGHAKQFRGKDYELQFLKEAQSQGKRIDSYTDTGASAYLFTFGGHGDD